VAGLSQPTNFTILLTLAEKLHSLAQVSKTIESLAVQSYSHFSITTLVFSEELAAHLAREGERLKLQLRIVHCHAATKRVLAQHYALSTISGGVLLLDGSSVLHPQALFILGKELSREALDLVYWNELLLDQSDNQRLSAVYFRRQPVQRIGKVPSEKYSILSTNLFGESLLMSEGLRAALVEDRYLREVLESSLSWFVAASALVGEFSLRLLPLALNVRLLPESLSIAAEDNSALVGEIGRRLGFPLSSVVPYQTSIGKAYRASPGEARGRVQVVIPFRNQIALTIACIRSLCSQNCVADLEVTLVNNNSDAEPLAELHRFLEALPATNAPLIRIVEDPDYFNFARLNNFGIASSMLSAEELPFVLLLNNDVELTDADTLAELRRWCALGDVGCVGGELRYPDGRVQHAGIGFWSVRPGNLTSPDHFTEIVRETNGVTFAMAMFKREALQAVGGLDQFFCPNGFGDALLCAELEKVGYRTVYTPFARATHHESVSRGRSPEELELYEMVKCGVPIPDLYADFYAEKQPMLLRLGTGAPPPLLKLAKRLATSPRLNRLLGRFLR